MPPFAKVFKRKSVLPGRVEEFRDVVCERWNLDLVPAALKVRLRPLILPERVQFADKELAVRGEHTRGLSKTNEMS